MIYDVNYFINKFEAIPESNWTIFTQMNYDGQRCALGHCMPENVAAKYCFGENTQEGKSLLKMFLDNNLLMYLFGQYHDEYSGVASINNGRDPRYQQPTPKQRILAALYDIRAKQQPLYSTDATQELIDSVVVGDSPDVILKQVKTN